MSEVSECGESVAILAQAILAQAIWPSAAARSRFVGCLFGLRCHARTSPCFVPRLFVHTNRRSTAEPERSELQLARL